MGVNLGPSHSKRDFSVKTLFASIFAVGLLAATAADAAHIGIQVGPIGVGTHVGYHHHGCRSWGWHHHHDRYCRNYW
jgi:hypothetical protein